MIQSVQAGYPIQSVQQASNAYAAKPVESTQSAGDKVTLSPEGMIASFYSGMGVDYTPGQTSISLEEIEEGLERKRTELTGNINALFQKNDISATPPVELTSDGAGNIRVKGDHPDKEKIERLFADNPDLANDFRCASAQASLVKAGKEHLEFAKEYAKNPEAAVGKYGSLFSALKNDEFSLLFGEPAGETA
jgi:hypothetical protein